MTLVHRPDCPARLDTTTHTAPDGRHVHTLRCLDCAAVMLLGEKEQPLAVGSDEWASAWQDDPERLARTLTPTERLDPQRNPCHPFASSWPPGREPKIGPLS